MVQTDLDGQDSLKNDSQSFWDNRYQSKNTGWDLGTASPPIKEFVDRLTNKSINILIPGCGNAYEAEYLLEQGFSNITLIDIAPLLAKQLLQKFSGNTEVTIIHGDFFQHAGSYDLIIEQTFFCALHPSLRKAYIQKMSELLSPNGKLVGLLFNRNFEQDGPPFGGEKEEYASLFSKHFEIEKMENEGNSISPRANSELWFELVKKP